MKKIIYALLALCLSVSFFSACQKEQPVPEKALKAPVLVAKADGSGVKLTWSSITNATSYQIEQKVSTESEWKVAGTPTHSPFTISDLEFGKTYEFRAKALNKTTESEYSKVVSVTLERTLPQPEIKLLAGISFIDVSWEPVEGATSYKVEHKASVDVEYITDYTGEANEFKIAGLSGGISYDVRVAALADGYSPTYSEVGTVATTAEPSNMIHNAAEFVAWLNTVDENYFDVAGLANDIDMKGVKITSAKGFAGTLEGQGFAIKNLVSDVPLFAKNSGTISNLVLDESCTFNAGSQIFGAFSAADKRAVYTNVTNKATVIYTAKGNVTGAVVLGGFAAYADSDSFTNCEIGGVVKLEASGYTHEAAFVGGYIGVTNEHIVFDGCKNSASVTLNAAAGNPRSALEVGELSKNNAGIAVGGFVGRGYDSFVDGENNEQTVQETSVSIIGCENTAASVVTLNHTDISKVSGDGSNGNVSVGGFVAHGNTYIYKCVNNGNVVAKGVSPGGAVSKKEYMLRAGGIQGHVYDYSYIGSSKMNGTITYENDCSADNSNMKPGVGGIIANGGYNGVSVGGLAEVFYDTMAGNIIVRGNGKNFCVGGISGFNCKQVSNKVLASCTIDCSISGDYICLGGITGANAGGYQNYTCSGCSCAANIIVETTDTSDKIRVGGLLGQWVGATGESFYARDGVASSFSGSLSSSSLAKYVGILFGEIGGTGKNITFGKADYPIKVSGKFGRADLPQTDITSAILDGYVYGVLVDKATIHVVLANE